MTLVDDTPTSPYENSVEDDLADARAAAELAWREVNRIEALNNLPLSLPPFMRERPTREPTVPTYSWVDFIRLVFRWRQGEHVGAIGPTGSGKTTLCLAILPFRKYTVAIGTKPYDDSLMDLVKSDHYVLIKKWENLSVNTYPKRVLWPDARTLDSVIEQRNVILHALMTMYYQSGGAPNKKTGKKTVGGWCVYIDELWVIIHLLKLEQTVKTYLQQARALDMSLVVGTQRPAFIPLEVYDQSTHLFFWRDNDETNLKRISGISWLSARMIRQIVASLPLHSALYINTRTGEMAITQAPPLATNRSINNETQF